MRFTSSRLLLALVLVLGACGDADSESSTSTTGALSIDDDSDATAAGEAPFFEIVCDDIARFVHDTTPELMGTPHVPEGVQRVNTDSTATACHARSYVTVPPGRVGNVFVSVIWRPDEHVDLPPITTTDDEVPVEEWLSSEWETVLFDGFANGTDVSAGCQVSGISRSGLIHELDEDGVWTYRERSPGFTQHVFCGFGATTTVGGLTIAIDTVSGGSFCLGTPFTLAPNERLDVAQAAGVEPIVYGPFAGPWCLPGTDLTPTPARPFPVLTSFTSASEIIGQFGIQQEYVDRLMDTLVLPNWLFDEGLANEYLNG